MELYHEKPDVSFGEIVYKYVNVNEYDYAITHQSHSRRAQPGMSVLQSLAYKYCPLVRLCLSW